MNSRAKPPETVHSRLKRQWEQTEGRRQQRDLLVTSVCPGLPIWDGPGASGPETGKRAAAGAGGERTAERSKTD